MRFLPFFLLLVTLPVQANQDADFLAAQDAFRAGDTGKLQRLAQRLKNTPLEVYVNYYQLRINLDKADARAMKKFLSRPEDTPIIDQLRGEWLKLLGNKQQWDLFDAEYPSLLNEDTELTCYILQSRLRNHDQAALHDARALWFSGKGLPESCNVPFEAAISAGIITKLDISQRLRLALESGSVSLAKQLFARLEGDQAVSAKMLDSAAADALRYLDKLKLDDPKSAAKAEPATTLTGLSMTGVLQIPADTTSIPLNPKLNNDFLPPPYSENSMHLPLFAGAGVDFTQALRSSTPDLYRSTKNILMYPLPDTTGWRAGLAFGCLEFTPTLPEAVLNMPNETAPVSQVCRNPCGMFNISATLAVQQSTVSARQNRLFLSDLRLGTIDTAAVEALLAQIRLSSGKPTASAAPIMAKDIVPGSPLVVDSATSSSGWSGWRSLLDRLGLAKPDDPPVTASDSGLRASSGCDSCATAGVISTVSPMEWNSKLASEGQRAIVLFALQRLAKQSPDLAAARWIKIAAYFPAPEQRYFYGWLAYEAARNLDERALQWYKETASTPLSEQQSAWRVRAALRAQDWREVLASIAAMSEQQQREAAWRYWKGRALLALGRPIEARELLAPLSGEYHFYGQLANEELAGAPLLSQSAASYKPDSQAISELLALPGIQRTLALYRMGLRNEALEEWRWVIRNFNDRELITAAEIARRNEMYDRAIGAADRTVSVHDFSLRYLAPYREMLQAHIREHGLEEAWVYGLMRQESRFVSSAKSNVGAAGLMQIMPATARWIANKLGLKSYRKALIQQLDTNLRLGTYYMKSILSQFDDSPVMASAAYNAGPRRAREWRGEQPLEGAIYAETIPFEETRDYVKKVMSNTAYYASQFNTPPRTFKQRLGIVAGRPKDKLQFIPSVPGEPAEP